jgi:hypothetical protein
MAWQGKTVREICQQLKDPTRNGGRDLMLIHAHAAGDDLVPWGWQPGDGRDPAPGTQQLFGELIQAWIRYGGGMPLSLSKWPSANLGPALSLAAAPIGVGLLRCPPDL